MGDGARSDRLPDVVTHIYDPERGAFRNLCSLPDDEAGSILAAIAASGRRAIKPNYLSRRRATEAWLLSERTRKLGPSRLSHPIYFFLGDFRDGADPSRPASIALPLAAFPAEMVTFTYPDSMTSFLLGSRNDLAGERQPHHGEVFTLDEITRIVATIGLPDSDRQRDPARQYDRYIEMQLWDEQPLASLNQLVDQFKFRS